MNQYIQLAAQFLAILGATSVFFTKMGRLGEKVDYLHDDVKQIKETLAITSDRTIALEAREEAKMRRR